MVETCYPATPVRESFFIDVCSGCGFNTASLPIDEYLATNMRPSRSAVPGEKHKGVYFLAMGVHVTLRRAPLCQMKICALIEHPMSKRKHLYQSFKYTVILYYNIIYIYIYTQFTI